MGWFSKKSDYGGKGDDGPAREHDRIECDGEKVVIVQDSGGIKDGYELLDISLGGFALTGYVGKLRGNQYFEFKFVGMMDGEQKEAEGFANVVRVKDEMLAAKFPPPPRLKAFLRDYIAAK